MSTLILLFTAVLFAGIFTFLLGFAFLKRENLWVGIIGMLTASVIEIILMQGNSGDDMLATHYLRHLWYGVGNATLLMIFIIEMMKWRRRVKAERNRARGTATPEIPRPRPRVQYYEKWDHPPWDPPRDPGHPKI